MDKYTSTLVFYVNGKRIDDNSVDPEWTLLQYLRTKLILCGSKLGCAEGGCGACTVMISKYNRTNDRITHFAINACLAPICSMHGLAVTTIEGIGSTRTKLHPVQERIAKAHGSQCGFCTPGIVMSMYTLLRNSSKRSMHDLEEAFQGNLCRCTGYRPIIEGFLTFTDEWEDTLTKPSQMNGFPKINGCKMGDNCCRNRKPDSSQSELFAPNEFQPYDPSQEPIFPPDLKLNAMYDKDFLIIRGSNVVWFRPTNLNDLLLLKSQYPKAKIIVGNTEVGVEVKFKHCLYPVLIQPSYVPEMLTIEQIDDGVKVGASFSLEELRVYLKTIIGREEEWKTRIMKEIHLMLRWFAGKQIRNVASIGGNIMTSSPISDLNPIWLASNAQVELVSIRGSRCVHIDQHFFTGYRRNIVADDEILQSIIIPYTKKNQYFCAFKQSKRREDDIAIVNSAIFVELTDDKTINDIRLAFGGMAPTTVLALKTSEKLKGSKWDDAMVDKAYALLLQDMPLTSSAPGGMAQYRRALTLSLFCKSFLKINSTYNLNPIGKLEASGADCFDYVPPSSTQFYKMVSSSQKEHDPVGRPIVHVSAFKQASGEAVYVDDIPKYKNELYLAFVLSTTAHAKILSVDESHALQMPGVHAFFSAKDVDDDRNYFGLISKDEAVFRKDTVTAVGQTIGVIIADNQIIAQRASKAVKVTYEYLTPIIVTIEDAIAANSFHGQSRVLLSGNYNEGFQASDFIVTGEARMSGQEHFYLETHCALVIPRENDELEVFCSTQHPTEIGKLIAELLNMSINRISVRAKRMGGAFGGKESRGLLVALPVALAAHKLNRPVRCMLDREEDMLMTGGRHPFYYRYKLGVDKHGKMMSLDVKMYSNGGYSDDLATSFRVLQRSMLHVTNAYKIPNVRVRGWVCKTNLPSNTAFRGFGVPQGMYLAETVIRHVAEVANIPIIEMMRKNFFNDGDFTHYGQQLICNTVRRCFEECLAMANFEEREREIGIFNAKNKFKKRAIAIVPSLFGIGYSSSFCNQAGALVHVYVDGSVLLSHGGTEMGQGLHTKMIQIASRVLDIPSSKIHITETATDKVPNTSATAASCSSDLNGMAVLNACQTIVDRLAPFKNSNPNGSWNDWVTAAYFDRVSLSTTGFYKTAVPGFDFEHQTGVPYNYFSYGAGCSEVEVDCLTGDHRVLRSDIVMDLGESLNPAIDIGQIEGGFMQGYGLFTLEELMYSPAAQMLTRGPGAYKLPGFGDIPLQFNVALLKGSTNPRAVYSSKAVGEPPLFLASSVFFAIKEAIADYRKQHGLNGWFRIDAPATAAKIRVNCVDNLMELVQRTEDEKGSPTWNLIP